jgi:hypothetical protein
MTDIEDLYEANDREPEANESGQQPLDLDDLQKLYDLAREPGALPSWGQMVYMCVPDLIAELREARERIAEFEALPTRERWTVTGARDVPPKAGAFEFPTYKAADRYGDDAKQLWRRMLSLHPWEPIDSEAPF